MVEVSYGQVCLWHCSVCSNFAILNLCTMHKINIWFVVGIGYRIPALTMIINLVWSCTYTASLEASLLVIDQLCTCAHTSTSTWSQQGQSSTMAAFSPKNKTLCWLGEICSKILIKKNLHFTVRKTKISGWLPKLATGTECFLVHGTLHTFSAHN